MRVKVIMVLRSSFSVPTTVAPPAEPANVVVPVSPMKISMTPVEPGKNCAKASAQLKSELITVGVGAGMVTANAVLFGPLASASSAATSVKSSTTQMRTDHENDETKIGVLTVPSFPHPCSVKDELRPETRASPSRWPANSSAPAETTRRYQAYARPVAEA